MEFEGRPVHNLSRNREKESYTTSVPAGGVAVYSPWYDSVGFDRIGITLTNESATPNQLDVQWSEDKVIIDGKETAISSGSNVARVGAVEVKGDYFRFVLLNTDSLNAKNMTAKAYKRV